MTTVLLIAIFGSMGALARYALTLLLPVGWFSWGVLVANVLGSFAAGWVFSAKMTGSSATPLATAVLIGFLGALTTFSSMSLDTARLLSESMWWPAVLNLLLNNLLSLAACVFGLRMATFS